MTRREVLQNESFVSCGNRSDFLEAKEGSEADGGEKEKCRVHGMAVTKGGVGDVVDDGEKERDECERNGVGIATDEKEREASHRAESGEGIA